MKPARSLLQTFLATTRLWRERSALLVEDTLDLGEGFLRILGHGLLSSAICRERPTGSWGEARAARFLRRRGLRILEKNYRVHSGEIDLVALEERTLVFVEVKTISTCSHVWGLDRLDPDKRRRLNRALRSYLAERRLDVDRWRLDAVIIEFERRRLRRRFVTRISWYPAVDA